MNSITGHRSSTRRAAAAPAARAAARVAAAAHTIAAMVGVAVLALAATIVDPVEAAAAAPTALAPALLRLDRLHERRDDAAALDQARRLADGAVAAAPTDYGTLWRAARVYFTLSDEPTRSDDQRGRLGQTAWELAQRAVAANGDDVAGHYWAALGVGSSATGMGVIRAVANGIEGKFKHELERATALDPNYDHGNVPVVWAAYYLEVPWPKRDRQKAQEYLRWALRINPSNLRAQMYLARIDRDQDRPAEARRRLAEIAAAPVGRYDPPEERRVKIEAARDATKLAAAAK
jgi:tetratricopeptide (TPR) repeat protein